jgi:hypothetical protein
MTAILNHQLVDPQYVRIKRKQAAEILGISPADFDRRRKEDPRCPKGYKEKENDRFAQVFFYLSDIYEYSDALKRDSIVVS